MKLKNKLISARSILKAKVFSSRIPLIISWHLVNRCNRKCKYCYRWTMATKELATAEVFSIIDELAEMGAQVIIFSGGEPLLRDDIGQIIHYSRSKEIFTGLTTNGDLTEEKIKDIKDLDLLKLSFDGPKKIHDFLRGQGSYDNVMKTIRLAKENHINLKFNTTLNKYSLNCIDFILQKSKEMDVGVKFQPVSHVHSLGRDTSHLFPESEQYKITIEKLIRLKKTTPFIINSSAALKYLHSWPQAPRIKCYAGKLICCIASEGYVYPCSAMRDKVSGISCLDPNFKEAFSNLPHAISCDSCWCSSTLELNCFMSFSLDNILNIRRLFA